MDDSYPFSEIHLDASMTVVDTACVLYQRCFSRIDAKNSDLSDAIDMKRYNRTVSDVTIDKLVYIFTRTLGLTATYDSLHATSQQIRLSNATISGMNEGKAKTALNALLLGMKNRLKERQCEWSQNAYLLQEVRKALTGK